MRLIRLIVFTVLSVLLLSCSSDISIPKEYRGPDGVYYGSAPANLTVVISNGGKRFYASGTLPWGESADFSGDIDGSGNMISSPSGNKCGRIDFYDDYVSSVYFLNYPVFREGEEKWRAENAALKEQLSNQIASAFLKKLKGKTDFYYDGDREQTVFLEFDTKGSDIFYEYIVQDDKIMSRKQMFLDENDEFLGSGKFLDDFGKIKAKGGKVIYKPEKGRPVKFISAGDKLRELKSFDIPEQYKWIISKWLKWSDNTRFLELFPNGDYESQICDRDGECVVESKGFYLIQESNDKSISISFFEDGEDSFVGTIRFDDESIEFVEGNPLHFEDGYGDGVDYFKFPSWLNAEWTDGEDTFTIKNNVLIDPHKVIHKYASGHVYLLASPDWSVSVGSNLIWLTSYSSSNWTARFYLNRESNELAIMDARGTILRWLHLVQHYSSPLDILEKLYPSSKDGSYDLSQITTSRFRFYEEVECEGDVLWQTQDAYTYVDNPAPKFTPYSGINNAYLVEWIRNDNDPKVKLIVVFVEENGGWKIDNVIEFDEDGPQDKLLFDYSKPPVPAYSDEAYSQELLDKINEMKKTLAD